MIVMFLQIPGLLLFDMSVMERNQGS